MNCPSCSQNVGFRSEQAPYTVCDSCNTLIVRKDVKLEVIGMIGECQPDSSPLQVGSQGRHLSRNFDVLGRIQVSYGEGFWNEWYIQYSDGKAGWLSDAMGQYFLSEQHEPTVGDPNWDSLKLKIGSMVQFGQTYIVLDRKEITVSSMEGELGLYLEPRKTYKSVDMRSANGDGVTVDFSGNEPTVYKGRYVPFAQLNLTGLRYGESPSIPVPQELIRAVKCASCGAPHELSTGPQSRTLVCQYCGTTNDSTGAEMKRIGQAVERAKELAASATVHIGATARLQDGQYKVIGFILQGTTYEGTDYLWKEYLLFNHLTGYRWLSESEGHFTLFEQLDGLPESGGVVIDKPSNWPATYNFRDYKHFQTSRVTVRQVVGEFYWRVKVGDTSQSFDYVAPPLMLSASAAATDLTWSQGRYVPREELARMLPEVKEFPKPRGVAPCQPNPYLGMSSKFHKSAIVAFLVACLVIGSGVFLKGTDTVLESGPLSLPGPKKLGWMTVQHDFEMPAKRDLRLLVKGDLKERWADLAVTVTPQGKPPLATQPVGLLSLPGATRTEVELYYRNVPAGPCKVMVKGVTAPPPPPPTLRKGDSEAQPPVMLTVELTGRTAKPIRGWGVMVLFIPLLLLPYLLVGRWNNAFEIKRWYESDYG